MVSVIVPNYNHSEYLEERIFTILNQTYQNFEIIILDDCSSDNSKDLLEQYRTYPKVTDIVFNEENSGSTFRQWKKGIELARFDWIWIAESDDLCELNFLECLVSHIKDDIGVITCRTQQIDSTGTLTSPGFFLADDVKLGRWNSDYSNEGLSEINFALKYRCTIPNASAVIFRKSLSKHLINILDFRSAGDWNFWIRCLREKGITFVSSPLAYHRHHDNTTRSLKSPQMEKERMYEFLMCIDLAHFFINKSSQHNVVKLDQYHWIYFELFQRSIPFKKLIHYRNLPISFVLGYLRYIIDRKKILQKIPQKIPQKIILKFKKFMFNLFFSIILCFSI